VRYEGLRLLKNLYAGLVICRENTNTTLVEEICTNNKSVGLSRGEFVYNICGCEDNLNVLR